MIKKKIKKHYLVYDLVKKWEDSGLLDGLNVPVTYNWPPGNPTGDGDMDELVQVQITGRLHSVGTVIWNQELQRLEYWDGAMWQHLVTNNIV
jgi:hypothetical protein